MLLEIVKPLAAVGAGISCTLEPSSCSTDECAPVSLICLPGDNLDSVFFEVDVDSGFWFGSTLLSLLGAIGAGLSEISLILVFSSRMESYFLLSLASSASCSELSSWSVYSKNSCPTYDRLLLNLAWKEGAGETKASAAIQYGKVKLP